MNYRPLPETVIAQSGPERKALRARARYLARITHPNVVHEFDLVETSDATRLEFVPTQAATLAEAALEISRDNLLRALSNAGSTIDSLHRAGIVHGSLTAETLLYTPTGRILISDFRAPEERTLMTNPDDDISCLIEIARLLLVDPKLDKKFRAILMRPDLPDAAFLAQWFEKQIGAAQNPRRQNSSAPTLRFASSELTRPRIEQFRLRHMRAVLAGILSIAVIAALSRKAIGASEATPVVVVNSQFEVREKNVSTVSGQFACRSTKSVLLLRRDDGSVWAFDDPSADEPSTGQFVMRREGASGLEIAMKDGCNVAQLVIDNQREVLEW